MTYFRRHSYSLKFRTSRRLLSTFALQRKVDERRLPRFIRILLRETRGERVKSFGMYWEVIRNYGLRFQKVPSPHSRSNLDHKVYFYFACSMSSKHCLESYKTPLNYSLELCRPSDIFAHLLLFNVNPMTRVVLSP